mmetsp:Transcript_9019/g.16257  ORF Transcript_9019/g.16257 Transcript_9019/m.16257 type:complete len:142 (-) Transcript_9019:194-619(-)|eukprot:CAMPEP_0177755734 /NCGR_PEP_ID=MMETSP0491_2-20121128/2726_1 /TAXON_ID=63592 /ORGANISM="Tetraselmis chuii, Strain PLY429" /LENGTH=141 /DNA_ID=CAMNT_0019271255 /DNA_START=69 /DNA_END=497 /DNA_ORIENTATION=+
MTKYSSTGEISMKFGVACLLIIVTVSSFSSLSEARGGDAVVGPSKIYQPSANLPSSQTRKMLQQTPEETPEETPESTPEETPYEAEWNRKLLQRSVPPAGMPQMNTQDTQPLSQTRHILQQTPEETPEETPDSTPDETPEY